MFKYFLSLLLLLQSTTALSIEVKDLYSAEVPVSNQTTAEREKAKRKALSAVILKVAGDESVMSSPAMQNAKRNYAQYITQFRYGLRRDQRTLVVDFDENKINQLFIDANLPLWGSLRPQVLMWTIVEDEFEREVVSSSSQSSIPNLVHDFSSIRGLPIILPLMDLTDAVNLNMSDLWGRFSEPVREVSERYAPEMVVVVRLSNNSLLPFIDEEADCQPLCAAPALALDWSLYSGSQTMTSNRMLLEYVGDSQEELMSKALADITHYIYNLYALATDNRQRYVIDVANVESMETYVEVTQFLQELSAVKSVVLERADGPQRRFSLELLGSETSFLATLKLNNKLKQFVDPLAQVEEGEIPVFLWEGR